MGFRFNGGKGCFTCDTCDTMITNGTQVIVPDSITVSFADMRDCHFCNPRHLVIKIERVTAAREAGNDCDDYWFGEANLAILVAEHARRIAIVPAVKEPTLTEPILLSIDEVHVLWAAMQVMVEDVHAPQDNLTERQWTVARTLLTRLDERVNKAAGYVMVAGQWVKPAREPDSQCLPYITADK